MFLLLLPLREAALPYCSQNLNFENSQNLSFDWLAVMAMLCQGWNEQLCCLNALSKAKSCLPVLALWTDYLRAVIQCLVGAHYF